MTVDYFQQERAEMQRRVAKVAADNGMAVPDAALVLDKAYAFGVQMPAVYLANLASDNDILAALVRLQQKSPESFATTSSTVYGDLSPEMARFMGGNAADWPSMLASKRREWIARFEQHKAEKAQQVSRAEAIRAELVLRHGPNESAWPLADRARLADAEGHQRSTTTTKPALNAAQTSAINALPLHHRGIAASAVGEFTNLQREIDQLRASTSGGPHIAQHRRERIAVLEQRQNALRSRFGTVLA